MFVVHNENIYFDSIRFFISPNNELHKLKGQLKSERVQQNLFKMEKSK